MSSAVVGRTDFIDRLRVVLTVLVIAHHTAITYGGSGSWFYREVTDGGTPSSLLLTLFCAVNQSFFMGMFFLLAGYFTPLSLGRKGAWQFLKDRVVRLGIPLLVFGYLLGPLAVALAGAASGRPVGSRWLELVSDGSFVIGPLWFAWALLLFALAAVAWQAIRPLRPAPGDACTPVPSSAWWLISAFAVGASALAIRQWVPVGKDVLGLQLGYFASYTFLFALGARAWRDRWLERIEASQAKAWGMVSLGTVPLLLVAAAQSGALAGTSVDFNGGLGLAAIAYAFWEPFVAWGVFAMLLWGFRHRFNVPSSRWKRWGGQAYAAFIVHAPILVGVAVALRPWDVPALLKFVVVAHLSTALSFAAAALVRRLPGAQRVL